MREMNLYDVALFLLRNKRRFLIHGVVALVVGILYSMTLTKYYKSTLLYTNLSAQSTSSGLMAMFANLPTTDVTGSYGYSKRLYTTLLESREIREEVIKEYDLIQVYKLEKSKNKMGLALKELNKNLTIKDQEEGGLGMTNVIATELTVVDKDPQRAADIANSLYTKMEQRIIAFGKQESARRISFLESQLASCELSLDSTRVTLHTFQKENHIYSVDEQASSVIASMGALKAEEIQLEKTLAYERNQYGDNHESVQQLRKQLSIVRSQIQKMEKNDTPNFFVGLENSLGLKNQFVDLSMQVEKYTQLKVLLMQQLEQRRIQSERNFSDLYLIDRATPPEYKFKPKRALVALGVFVFWMMMVVMSSLYREFEKVLEGRDLDDKQKKLLDAFRKW